MANYIQYLYLIKQVLKFIIQYVLPLVAITLSWLSYKDATKNREIRERLNILEEKIKIYELEKIEQEKTESTLACVEARIVNISRGQYRLKIWNSGRATAYNVDYKMAEDSGAIIVEPKVPYEFLEAGKSFEENILIHLGTKSKFGLITTWIDEEGQTHSKEQIVSI